jgi:hypothetical protein
VNVATEKRERLEKKKPEAPLLKPCIIVVEEGVLTRKRNSYSETLHSLFSTGWCEPHPHQPSFPLETSIKNEKKIGSVRYSILQKPRQK